MDDYLAAAPWLVGCALGVTLHAAVFNHGEWHKQSPELLLGHAWAFLSLTALRYYLRDEATDLIVVALRQVLVAYLVSLFTSIIIYRIAFHRLSLAKFPGPWHMRISKLFHVWICRRNQNQFWVHSLREKYGDFVRTGPSEITCFDPRAFVAIDGPNSECIKSEFYDLLYPQQGLVTTRDKHVHAARRKDWAKGFSSAEAAKHQVKIRSYVDRLDDFIAENAASGMTTDTRNLCYWYGFDVMGEIVFSKSFNMLKERKWHHIITRIQEAIGLLGPFTPTPWLIQLGFRMGPRIGALKDWFDMRDWCEQQMKTRIYEDKQAEPDLAHFLMEKREGYEFAPREDTWMWCRGDSMLAIIAGSDPTATSLIGCFCELAKHPEVVEKLYVELADYDAKNVKALGSVQYLNAVLNEAMRLYPALMTGGQRKTSKNGAWIGDTFVPPETTVVVPRYSISRREDCFEKAREFAPERFTTNPEMVKAPAAFTPWGTGNRACPGRYLAMDIMRVCVATIVKKYTLSFAPGEDGSITEAEATDQFVALPGPLNLRFTPRK